jgi:hypothetical protein
MTHPVQWEYDLSDVLEVRDYLYGVVRSGRSLCNHRAQLRRQCDKLNDVVCELERSGLAETHSAHYLCIFDALSFLTLALRFQIIPFNHLVKARDLLAKLPRIGGEE